jgi:nucleotide-binding universal stress UspA family protein
MTGIEAVLLNVQHATPVAERLFKGSRAALRKLEEPLRSAGGQALDKPASMLREAGVPCTAIVEVGDPGPIIAACARGHGCDMIVMGTRGLNAVGKLLLGSVAVKVLHLSHVPVMLVK